MIKGDQFPKFLIVIFISIGFLLSNEIKGLDVSSGIFQDSSDNKSHSIISSKEVDKLNLKLKGNLLSGNFSLCKPIIETILMMVSNSELDELTRSESYYLIGIYYSFTNEFSDAIQYLNLCIALKEKRKEYDELYAKALYNIGIMYFKIGNFNKHEEYSIKSLEIKKEIYGDSSPLLIDSYSSLAAAYIELQDYEKSLLYSNYGLAIATKHPENVDPYVLFNLYYNLGVVYIRLADITKTKLYLEKAEIIYKNNQLNNIPNYINLLNSMAITYENLGLLEKSNEYYEKGISLALSTNSAVAYNLINSYSISLGNASNAKKGASLLYDALSRAKIKAGEESGEYYEVVNNYASYLTEYKIDNKKSLELYGLCLDYLENNNENSVFRTSVLIGYSRALNEAGENQKALEIIQSLLFPGKILKSNNDLFTNPDINGTKIDKINLNILRLKYQILWSIYKKSYDQKILEAASSTSELIVALIEKLRINISEDESRLILGDKYRNSYIDAIHNFNLLYSNTGDNFFLVKAFEYSEKSKVAGLLASTRELKALQFNIPSHISNLEKKLQRDISLFNERISDETVKENPDLNILELWRDNLLETTRLRDSLILVFEKLYPDYYAIKYNTHVAEVKDIVKIAGRNGNYINYIVSDTLLYIFLANRKHLELLTERIDSAFFNNIRAFKNLLSNPSYSGNARADFKNYLSDGFELYKLLLKPLAKYFISNKIMISPDNILSYIPFGAIPMSAPSDENIFYRNISYMMDYFDISYTYSATFLLESSMKNYGRGNKTIAFAPDYPDPVDIQSVLKNRQSKKDILRDLPYAREEARFVSNIYRGDLYLNSDAKESVFKKEAGNFDIIHLAMHTIINDDDPMRSTLIFNKNDSLEDGLLKTYEVYGIPLKAKMVVLSSCNTGSGHLSSGEGILSLARGFIYSGSQSVVMSMWEIEDRSGTEIVKMFYENLKKGYSKSEALQKARISYLRTADQLRSHPYFWSSLVVYGDNSPLNRSRHLIISVLITLIIIVILISVYLRKRKYS